MKAMAAPRIVSALTARTQLGQIMRRAAERQDRFVVDKRGRPLVVIMGVKDFIRTIAPEAAALARIRAEARRKGKARLSMRAIDREVAAYRRERRSRP